MERERTIKTALWAIFLTVVSVLALGYFLLHDNYSWSNEYEYDPDWTPRPTRLFPTMTPWPTLVPLHDYNYWQPVNTRRPTLTPLRTKSLPTVTRTPTSTRHSNVATPTMVVTQTISPTATVTGTPTPQSLVLPPDAYFTTPTPGGKAGFSPTFP